MNATFGAFLAVCWRANPLDALIIYLKHSLEPSLEHLLALSCACFEAARTAALIAAPAKEFACGASVRGVRKARQGRGRDSGGRG